MTKYFDVQEACEAIPCSNKELRRLIFEEEIEAVEVGLDRLISVEEVSRYRAKVKTGEPIQLVR
jgi:excisionase family DNA binding protein